MENHLSVPINKRFVKAMQWIHEHKRISFRALCTEMGYAAESFDKLKRGERSLPPEYHAPAARVFDHYGISSKWFISGTGHMQKDTTLVNDDNMLLDMLRKELQLKEKLLRKLVEENAELKERLRAYEP